MMNSRFFIGFLLFAKSLNASQTYSTSDSINSLFAADGLVQRALGAVEGIFSSTLYFDYIVAGGGTAGNTIGVRLAEAGYRVAIVEAGVNYEVSKPVLGMTPAGDLVGIGASMSDSIPTVDWGFQTVPQAGANNRKIHYTRGKCLGGSSALNFMLYHRGTTGTYDQWAELTGDESYRLKEFNQFFKKSATFTPPNESKRKANASSPYFLDDFAPSGQGGPIQVGYTNWVSSWATWLEQGLKALGLNRTEGFNRGDLLGYHYAQTTIRSSDATRSSSARYIYDAREKNLQSLRVFTSSHVTRVLFDANKKATGVQVQSLGVTHTLKAKKEVILSAGAFQSPQLLMVSGIGPPDTLNELGIPVISALPGVGQNMWDHIFFGPAYSVNFPTLSELFNNPTAFAAALAEYGSNRAGPLSSNCVELLGWEKLPKEYRTKFSSETEKELAKFPSDWPEVEHLSVNGYISDFNFPVLQQPLDNKQYASITGAMVAPVSRGNVTITSASALVKPEINPNWLTAKADQEVAIAWYRRMRDVFQTPKLNPIIDGQEAWPGKHIQTDEEILELIRNSLMTVWHAACTCKMGKKADPMAVVDSSARVFGVRGLRVVDASAMPLLPPGHPQSTVYALAEKIADAIIRDLQ